MAKKIKVKKKIKEVAAVDEHMAPTISEGLVSIAMLPTDLITLTNLMVVCAKTFEDQAVVAASQNDEQNYLVLSARHKLSSMFASRFVEFCSMGEPESRDMH